MNVKRINLIDNSAEVIRVFEDVFMNNLMSQDIVCQVQSGKKGLVVNLNYDLSSLFDNKLNYHFRRTFKIVNYDDTIIGSYVCGKLITIDNECFFQISDVYEKHQITAHDFLTYTKKMTHDKSVQLKKEAESSLANLDENSFFLNSFIRDYKLEPPEQVNYDTAVAESMRDVDYTTDAAGNKVPKNSLIKIRVTGNERAGYIIDKHAHVVDFSNYSLFLKRIVVIAKTLFKEIKKQLPVDMTLFSLVQSDDQPKLISMTIILNDDSSEDLLSCEFDDKPTDDCIIDLISNNDYLLKLCVNLEYSIVGNVVFFF